MKEQTMKTLEKESTSLPTGTRLYRFNGVPVLAKSSFWPLPFLLTGVLTWLAGLRNPKRTWLQRLGAAILAMPVALFADVGHAMAHTLSARAAGAPMDEILLSSEMPRTLYRNNQVAPHTHITRSLGGPIFSLTCAALSLLWHMVSPRGSLSRDLADASLAGHSFILLGSVVPMPMVDGGIILKWKLVEAGRSPEQAERRVRQISVGLGAAVVGLGVGVGTVRKWKLVGGLLSAGGAAVIAAGLGWLK